MCDEPDDEHDYLLEAVRKSRGYATFYEWPLDKSLEEYGVGETLLRFLFGKNIPGRLLPVKNDPPDLLLEFEDGRRVGIEVTEMVCGQAAAQARYLKENDVRDSVTGLPQGAWTWWSPEKIAKRLTDDIAKKDGKLMSVRDRFDEIILAIHTDEPDIDWRKAEQVLKTYRATTNAIARAFLLMGYDPSAKSLFPDGYPVFEIALA